VIDSPELENRNQIKAFSHADTTQSRFKPELDFVSLRVSVSPCLRVSVSPCLRGEITCLSPIRTHHSTHPASPPPALDARESSTSGPRLSLRAPWQLQLPQSTLSPAGRLCELRGSLRTWNPTPF